VRRSIRPDSPHRGFDHHSRPSSIPLEDRGSPVRVLVYETDGTLFTDLHHQTAATDA
jgi:hypothetical protein